MHGDDGIFSILEKALAWHAPTWGGGKGEGERMAKINIASEARKVFAHLCGGEGGALTRPTQAVSHSRVHD